MLWLALCALLMGLSRWEPASAQAAAETPQTAQPFTLNDIQGKPQALADYKGRTCVLFFYCGCGWCHECARLWGQTERSSALPLDSAGRPPVTLVVYAGDAAATRAFADSEGLSPEKNVLLPDPTLQVTRAWKSVVCPRAFVIDPEGRIRYTNDHAADAPRKVPAAVIVNNVIGALRSGAPATPPAAPSRINPTAPAHAPGLTIVSGGDVEGVGPNSARCNLGPIDVFTVHRVERKFTIRNDNDVAVPISRVGASCGCTSALLGAAPQNEASPGASPILMTLAPGQKTSVNVTFDPTHQHEGPLHKMVWVYGLNGQVPMATLELTGTIQAPISFSPMFLSFEHVDLTAIPTRTLTVTLDTRLLRNGKTPRLLCSNPDVLITEAANRTEGGRGRAEVNPAGISSPSPPSAPSGEGGAGRKTVERVYNITLSPHIPIGMLNATIRFELPASAAAGAPESGLPQSARPGAQAVIVGTVVGKVGAAPNIVIFGAVRAGQTATQRVMLTGDPASLEGAKAECGVPGVIARIVPPPAGAPAPANGRNTGHALEVTLGPEVPPGSLQSQILVTLADGTRLALPLFANVFRPAQGGAPSAPGHP
jgi:peroxiredoxin